MSAQPWHGLSHTRAWGHVGDSYSALAQADLQVPHSDGTRLAGSSSQKAEPAGLLSTSKAKGAGTFQLQSDWSLSAAGAGSATYCSEVADKFRSPPQDARPAESQAQKGKLSSFPKEAYPSDFKTTKQIDFESERLKNCKMPARAQHPSDSGILLGSNYKSGMSASRPLPQVTAGPAQERLPWSDGTMRKTGGIIVPAYNIINGDLSEHSNMEKYWHGNQMDFRRRR